MFVYTTKRKYTQPICEHRHPCPAIEINVQNVGEEAHHGEQPSSGTPYIKGV